MKGKFSYLLAAVFMLMSVNTIKAQTNESPFSYGGSFGFTFNHDYLFIQIAPQVGYNIVDPLTLYFGVSYEFIQQGGDNDNTIGALVGFRYEFVTFGQNSDYSTGLLLTTGYNINYVIPNYTKSYLQNVWRFGVGLRQSVSPSASIYITVTWDLWNQNFGWVWVARDWTPHVNIGFAF